MRTRSLALAILAPALLAAGCSDDDLAAETPDVSADTADDAAADTGVDAVADTTVDSAPDVDEDAIDPNDWSSDPFPEGEIGGDRPAEIVLPTDYAPDREWPVVTLLHGYTASAFIQDSYFGVSGLADELGVIVLLPNGTQNAGGSRFWNATDWCCDFERTGVDDAGYLMGLLDEVEAAIPTDSSRVVFIGHSNGGFMSYHLACDYSERVTAIVSLAGLEWVDADRCQPSNPVTVLQIHGTNDETVAFDEDRLLPSAPETADRWVARNGCVGEPASGLFNFESTLEGDETTTDTWADCDRGTGVGLWVIPDGSHIPGLAPAAIRTALEFALDRPRSAE